MTFIKIVAPHLAILPIYFISMEKNGQSVANSVSVTQQWSQPNKETEVFGTGFCGGKNALRKPAKRNTLTIK